MKNNEVDYKTLESYKVEKTKKHIARIRTQKTLQLRYTLVDEHAENSRNEAYELREFTYLFLELRQSYRVQ